MTRRDKMLNALDTADLAYARARRLVETAQTRPQHAYALEQVTHAERVSAHVRREQLLYDYLEAL
jgi:hypothetical protein